MVAARIGYVVVAAGSGTRLGLNRPKAFVEVRGEPMIAHTLRTLAALQANNVAVVVPESALTATAALSASFGINATITVGGSSRQASVLAGLTSLAHSGAPDVVLIHDAARPFTPAEVFIRVAEQVRSTGDGSVPAIPVVDTIARVDSDCIVETPNRSTLRAVQTPQGFPFTALLAAHSSKADGAEFTDDAAVYSAAGGTVRVVEGSVQARKITTSEDLEWAEGEPHRVGTGIDAHAFSSDPTVELWLAGLHWPGEPGLEGHSDGDVACHALVDALLGAANLGDIGGMFGTDDPQFAGARGAIFLAEAVRQVRAAGWHIQNGSVEIVGNRPKLAARRAEAEAHLSGVLGAPVNLAATTTDGLGLTGEGRGVGAIASVLLGRP